MQDINLAAFNPQVLWDSLAAVAILVASVWVLHAQVERLERSR